MRRISPQSPQNGKNTHPIAPEGEKCRKIAKNEPKKRSKRPENGRFSGLGGVWKAKNRGLGGLRVTVDDETMNLIHFHHQVYGGFRRAQPGFCLRVFLLLLWLLAA